MQKIRTGPPTTHYWACPDCDVIAAYRDPRDSLEAANIIKAHRVYEHPEADPDRATWVGRW